jgi:hypothetical protein
MAASCDALPVLKAIMLASTVARYFMAQHTKTGTNVATILRTWNQFMNMRPVFTTPQGTSLTTLYSLEEQRNKQRVFTPRAPVGVEFIPKLAFASESSFVNGLLRPQEKSNPGPCNQGDQIGRIFA